MSIFVFDAVKAFADALRGDIAATSANLLTAVDPSATPTNTTADATTAGTAILTKIVGGRTIVPFTSSNAAWVIPTGVTRMWAGCINGGGKGGTGLQGQGTFAGGLGGTDGGYIWQELDLTGLTLGVSTLAIVVGAAATTAGALGGTSTITASTGVLITGVSGTSGIVTIEGAYLTSSQPGSGGNGGTAADTPVGSAGSAGGNSGAGVGGSGGAGRNTAGTATAGSAGVAGSSTAPMIGGSGGGGGGGAAGSTVSTFTGGAGGNGGFPGGGSGGGGAAARQQAFATSVGGLGGTPGNGLVVIVYM